MDAFGHKQLGGLAANLADIVKREIGCKVRGIEFSLMQRCAAHLASATDINESFLAGKSAVEYAVNGVTGKMIGFVRNYDEKGNYICCIRLVDLQEVANAEKKVPDEWINAEGNGINEPFIEYVMPLIQGEPQRVLENGLPLLAKLKKIRAK